MLAFADRPLAARIRPELVVQPLELADRRCWRIKDPVSLEYFELSDQEYAILKMLDGRSSLGEIRRRFERLFAPLQLTLGQLQAYVANLHHAGLILAEAPGQGPQLLKRARSAGRAEFVSTVLNLLSIRFRGVDPDRVLTAVAARSGWMVSLPFLAFSLVLIGSALLLAGLRFDTLRAGIAAPETYFIPANLAWLALAVVVAKVVHELGHALACKHLGGECHEIGVLLLAFTPCLYCDVSDAWLMPRRRARIAVSAAGVLVEMLLAAVCTWLWWWSEPGLFHALCLNIMLVCSVSTLLFNANPLLRYDGYFILSDLIDEPNLGARASTVLGDFLRRHCLGIDAPADPRLTPRRTVLLGVYALLAGAYRWFVLGLLLWICYGMLQRAGLSPLGHGLIAATLVGVLLQPVRAGAQLLNSPLRRRQVRPARLFGTVLAAGAVLAAICLLPVPQRVRGLVVIQSRGGQPVYVSAAGRLVHALPAGTQVRPGEVIGRLANLDLERDVEKLRGEHAHLKVHLENLEARRADDPEAASQIPATREMLVDLEQRLKQRRRDAERLTLVAPAAGTLLPPPAAAPAATPRGGLARRQGTPLDPENAGCWLEQGLLFCLVGQPDSVEPILILNQSDVDLVRPGQRVKMALEQLPGHVVTGTIAEIAATDMQVVPRELTSRIAVAPQPDPSGPPLPPRPADTMYQARVRLDPSEFQPLLRTCGDAKVTIAPLPLGAWCLRTIQQTFRFRI